MYGRMRPTRPIASWMVATPYFESSATSAGSGRSMRVRTIPRLFRRILFSSWVVRVPVSETSGGERAIQARVDATRVPLEDLGSLRVVEVGRGVDVAPGVVEVVAGARVDAADRADHLAGEQDVLRRHDLGEQVDARLVVDARVDVHVAEEVLLQLRLAQRHGQTPEPAPVVGDRAAAVRDDEL